MVIVVGPALDRYLGLDGFQTGVLGIVLGGLMLLLAIFCRHVVELLTIDPRPGHAATGDAHSRLLTSGPFAYCRNPMTLGTILAYLGLGIMVGTVAGVAIVLVLAGLLLFYLKRIVKRSWRSALAMPTWPTSVKCRSFSRVCRRGSNPDRYRCGRLKMEMERQQVAPCGIDCRVCWAYIRQKNTCPGCRVDEPYKSNSCISMKLKTARR